MEELAVWGAVGFGGAVEVAGDEDQRLVEAGGAEVVDLMWRVMARTLRGRLSLLMASSRSAATMPPWMWPGGHSLHCGVELDVCGVAVMGSGSEVSVVKVRWRPWGLAGPREAVIGALVDCGGIHRGGGVAVRRVYEAWLLVCTLATVRGGMNSGSVFLGMARLTSLEE